MRLVDVDALNKKLQKRLGSPTDDKLYEVNLCIIDSPTIDAIPVKWLEKRWRETLPDGVEPDFDINYAFQEVMSEWHQEQEGDDATD